MLRRMGARALHSAMANEVDYLRALKVRYFCEANELFLRRAV